MKISQLKENKQIEKSFNIVLMIVNAYLFNRHFIGHHQSTAGLVI